jgi:hypothetical protein
MPIQHRHLLQHIPVHVGSVECRAEREHRRPVEELHRLNHAHEVEPKAITAASHRRERRIVARG